VAFAWNGEQQDGFRIYVTEPGSSQALRLTTESGNDDAPAWSPDGRWIAYVHIAPDQSRALKLVSPLGGPPRVVPTSWMRIGVSSWARDSRSLVVETVAGPDQPGELWAVAVTTDDRRQLTWPPAGILGDTDPAVSPDGRVLAFCRATVWRSRELYLVDLQSDGFSTQTPRRLTNLGFVERPAWTPDGRRILFGAFREGAGIWQIDRSGGNPRPVFGLPETASLPALSLRPAGHTSLAFTNSMGASSIWRYGVEPESGSAPLELAASSRSQHYPSYSPDGKRLAFTSTRTGYQEIWVADADGSHPTRVTDLRHRLTEQADWSPAGDLLAFVSQDRGDRQIYLVNSTGGVATAITNERGIRFGGGWSQDGTGYYYTSTRSGRSEVWKTPRSGGAAKQVTVAGGQCGFESPGGVFYYWGLDGASGGSGHAVLMRRSPGGDREVVLVPEGIACKTAPSPAGFYFKSSDAGDIYLYDEAGGNSRRVLRHPPSAYSFTMSPDGRWFAIELAKNQNQDLMIMERFR
jgi:Tol biopolymer transport system component